MSPVATTSAPTMLQAWKRAWCLIHFFFAGVLPGSDCHVSVSGVRPWGVLPPAGGSWGPCQGGPGYQVGHPPLHHQPVGPHQGPPGGWAAPLSGRLVWLSQVLKSSLCVYVCRNGPVEQLWQREPRNPRDGWLGGREYTKLFFTKSITECFLTVAPLSKFVF